MAAMAASASIVICDSDDEAAEPDHADAQQIPPLATSMTSLMIVSSHPTASYSNDHAINDGTDTGTLSRSRSQSSSASFGCSSSSLALGDSASRFIDGIRNRSASGSEGETKSDISMTAMMMPSVNVRVRSNNSTKDEPENKHLTLT